MKAENRNKHFKSNIKNFDNLGGYFIGQFMGNKGHLMLETDEVEVAWKKLPTEFSEDKSHYHKTGVEVTIVVAGSYRVIVGNEEVELDRGDFLVVYPEEKLINISSTEGTEVIVVKAPSVAGDKFIVDD